MRILIINSEFPPIGGGAGNASANIARKLAGMGNDVLILTSTFGDLPREEFRDGIHIRRIKGPRQFADRTSAFEQGTFILTSSWAVLWNTHRWKPDASIAFFGVPAGPSAMLAKWCCKVPYIVSLRGGDVPGFRPYDFARYHKRIAPLVRMVWKNAFAVISNSHGLRTLAMDFDNHYTIGIIPNGVNVDKFSPPARRDWDPARMLFVGRLVHQKGLDLLLPALAKIRSVPWELTIVGDGPMHDPLQQMTEQLEIQQKVRFAGWKHDDDLNSEYDKANLFVLPSRHEGMPNVVLEAMASGLPILATRVAGNDELVLPGVTGELVGPESTSEILSALEMLLPNASLRRRMGTAGRKRAQEHFSWESTAQQYLNLIKSAQGKN